jgi:hypothetical protein
LRHQETRPNLLLIFKNIGIRKGFPVTITATEDYAQLLAILTAASNREERAGLLDAMAAHAGQTAAGYSGRGVQDDASDPLAWTETATLLTRLAAAERGFILQPADPEDRDPSRPWADLAIAGTPGEYEAAFAAVLKQLAGTVREPAIGRVAAAAQACAAARRETAAGA